jgi:hypothetical protein
MADGSSTGSGGEYYQDAAVHAEMLHQSMAKTAQSMQIASQYLASFSSDAGKVRQDFEDIGKQVLINPELLSTSKEFEASALKVVNHYGKMHKHAGAILKLNEQIVRLEKDVGNQKGKQAVHSRQLLANMKKVVSEYKKGEKSQSNQGTAWKQHVRTVQRYAGAVTGLNISLMGVVAMIVDTANIIRKINAYAKAGAAHLGDGAKAVYQTKSAMFSLRRDFALAYDEAGKVVNAITAMGFAGEDVANKAPMLKSVSSLNRRLVDTMAAHEQVVMNMEEANYLLKEGETHQQAYNRLMDEYTAEINKGKEHQKNLTAEIAKMESYNKRVTREAKQQVSLTSELYAIERKYGIQVQQSGGIIKTLQQDYSATNMEARNLLGVAIKMGTSLRKQGVPIGISELLEDWGKLIEKTKVYKTDLLGVLGLYNTMIKKDIAKRLGLGGVAKSVKMDIAKTMTSMALDMEFGWKARIGMRSGLGRSPVEAGIKFEKMLQESPLKGFQAVVKELTFMVGDIKKHPYEAEYRGRQLFQHVGFGKESSVVLARAVASGNLTEDKVRKVVEQQLAEQKELKELEKKWAEGRVELVKSAGNIAKGQQDFQALLRKWIEDKIMMPLMGIYEVLQSIYAWFAGGETAANLEYKKAGSALKETLNISSGKDIKGFEYISQSFNKFASKKLVGESQRLLQRESARLLRMRSEGKSPEEMAKAGAAFHELRADVMSKEVQKLYSEAISKLRKRRMTGTLNQLIRAVEANAFDRASDIVVETLGKKAVADKVARSNIKRKSGLGKPILHGGH